MLTHENANTEKTNEKKRNETNEDNRPTDTQHHDETFTEQTTLMVMHNFSPCTFLCLLLYGKRNRRRRKKTFRVVVIAVFRFRVRYCFSSLSFSLFVNSELKLKKPFRMMLKCTMPMSRNMFCTAVLHEMNENINAQANKSIKFKLTYNTM